MRFSIGVCVTGVAAFGCCFFSGQSAAWSRRKNSWQQHDSEELLLGSLVSSDSHASARRVPLQSTGHLIRQHQRRLRRENRSTELFQLEEELIDVEAYRHLSRYERFYRLQGGLDLEFGWDGSYNESMFAISSSSSRGNQTGKWNRRRLDEKEAPASSFTKMKSGKFDNYQAVPLSQGYGTHIANIWVGSPKPQRKTVIVDTGSHYTAFPCKGCSNCGRSHHTDPYFSPSKSETYHQLQCDECAGGVLCEKGRCHFSQAYTEGSSWDAIQVKDRFYCGGSDVLDSVDPFHQKYAIDFMFGCMTKMSGRLKIGTRRSLV